MGERQQGDETRRRLEAVAYGDRATDGDRADAFRELARLAGGRGAGSSGRSYRIDAPAGAARDQPAENDADDLGDGAAEPDASGPRRPRVPLALMLVAALVVGGGIGAGVTAAVLGDRGTATDASQGASRSRATGLQTPDSASTSRLAAGDPAVGAGPQPATSSATEPAAPSASTSDVAATIAGAKALFHRAPTAADDFPIATGFENLFVPSSTRWMGGTDHTAVFIARQASPAGFCLLTANVLADGSKRASGVSCASEADFVAQGLSYGNDDITVSWSAGDISLGGAGGTAP